uniref:Neuropeptide Y receptor type 1-like n=1 Tax=Dermatophagoides pteronyssinus TaxID=6956 RepID=A0A6P6XLL9_DERPT|nr:neuropeptide Y receptor type 1-like [Dermatophagoides pteronyssinus]
MMMTIAQTFMDHYQQQQHQSTEFHYYQQQQPLNNSLLHHKHRNHNHPNNHHYHYHYSTTTTTSTSILNDLYMNHTTANLNNANNNDNDGGGVGGGGGGSNVDDKISLFLNLKSSTEYLIQNNHNINNNITETIENLREFIMNLDNYSSPSYRATLTRRNILIITFYLTIVIISLFGNLIVCYVVFKRKHMRISTNLLMTNLALSDLIMTVINIPFNLARILLNDWPFGSLLCILVPLIQVTSVYVSTLTMTIIAIDRYQAILNPLNKRITTTLSTSLIIIVIWIAAALFSIPNIIFNRVVNIGHLQRCRAIYPKPEISYRRFVTLFTFLTQYAIPLSITAIAYIRISFYIWSKLIKPNTSDENLDDINCVTTSSNNDVPMMATTSIKSFSKSNDKIDNVIHLTNHNMNNDNVNHHYKHQQQPTNKQRSIITKTSLSKYHASINTLRERSRRKPIKMLALVVVVFSICWLPLNIFHLNSDFFSNNRISDPNIFFICHWFAMSSVCYNPFIYFWLNHHYRQEIKHLVRYLNILCMKQHRRSTSTKTTTTATTMMMMRTSNVNRQLVNHHSMIEPQIILNNNDDVDINDKSQRIPSSSLSNDKKQRKQFRSNVITTHHHSFHGPFNSFQLQQRKKNTLRSINEKFNDENNNNNNNTVDNDQNLISEHMDKTINHERSIDHNNDDNNNNDDDQIIKQNVNECKIKITSNFYSIDQ